MKTVHRWLKAILCSAMLVLLASCAAYHPTDTSVGNMSVERARYLVDFGFKNGCIDFDAKAMDGGCEHPTGVRVTSRRLFFTGYRGERKIYIFSELPEVSGPAQTHINIGNELVLLYNNSSAHKQIIDALYVLKKNAIKQKTDAVEYEPLFVASLPEYRKKASENTTLPEEANKYKVQADGALRDKEFDEAADFYAEALKIAPWWPAGHFNRALVLGETGDYEMAMRDMKHYLQLVPDAPNARAAQDKIYDWERLESR